ncbi:hypothetical protein NMY22_g4257 [Coprinellus aureogranulatus]|nr:hypothetical protein NMY22_g4257 [Coprinellus aureogranulatus]
MAARTLQPSEYEIQREVEALRDIRRRSTNPGALAIDPDLPNQSPPSSPTAGYWSPGKPKSAGSDSASLGSSTAAGSSSGATDSTLDDEISTPNNPADDPFHLFWVPASVHPEIAPAEFKAFLKEHARNPPAGEGQDGTMDRAASFSSRSSLSRKRSMLSRQYQPKEGDHVEDENIVPLRRNASFARNKVPQLTISDLQKLEELAEEATLSADSSKLRNVLRRSLSLNMSPTAIENMDVMPDLGDEADAPIIVPPPGQILRRAARTKIRKPGLPGDGAGHRFGSSRRMRRSSTEGRRTSGELSSSENGEYETLSPPRRQTMSDDGFVHNRPDSFSEEASIFDAYARDEEEDPFATPVAATPAPEPTPSATPRLPEQPVLSVPEIQPSLLEALAPVLQQSEPITLTQPSDGLPSPPQPAASFPPQPQQAQQQQPPTPLISPQPPHILAPIPQQHNRKEKEKDKKGLFGKWGGDKGGKKSKHAAAEKEKEKNEGFFGSLFGGKKKQDDAVPVVNSAGREAAQALLGASKSSKNYVPPPSSPGLAPGSPNFARYPIHVERAIYRLSHIKLANPRRPLYEQVLISNLMFWYLGVINKAQAATQSPEAQSEAEKEAKEKEQKEKEAKEKAEKERQEKEQRERELEAKKRESGRRGSLTKTPAGGAPPGRRAEMPIKGPQYEMQQQVMQKEYNGFNGQTPPGGRPPMQNGPNGQPYQGPPRGPGSPQPQQFPQQQYQPPPPQAQIYPPQGQPYQQPYPPAPGQQYPNAGPPRGGPPPQGRPPGPDHVLTTSRTRMVLREVGCHQALWLLWDLALSKLYANCLLSTLNARATLKESTQGSNARQSGQGNRRGGGSGAEAAYIPPLASHIASSAHTHYSEFELDDAVNLNRSITGSMFGEKTSRSDLEYGVTVTKVVETLEDPRPTATIRTAPHSHCSEYVAYAQ